MDKEQFQKLPYENQKSLVHFYLDLVMRTAYERSAVLPVISVLAAALLVIATFNERLLPLNNLVKFLLSVLMILIPISLFFYIQDLKNASRKFTGNVNKLLGTNVEIKIRGPLHWIPFYYPEIAVSIIGVVITVLIVMIWIS